MKKTIAKQVEGQEIPLIVLAESVKAISEGIKKLRAGPINDRALLLLIQDATPSVGGRYHKAPIPIRDIKAVLEGLESLEATYLKKKPAK